MVERTEFPDGCYRFRYDDGYEYWFDSADEFHRLDGPAIIGSNGYEAYYLHGVQHRLDGPAYNNGKGSFEHWVNGEMPLTIMDMIIIGQEIDHEMFPSAVWLPEANHEYARRYTYRLSPDDLTLAILRYS